METLLSLLHSLHSETNPEKRKLIEPQLQKFSIFSYLWGILGTDSDTFFFNIMQLLSSPIPPCFSIFL